MREEADIVAAPAFELLLGCGLVRRCRLLRLLGRHGTYLPQLRVLKDTLYHGIPPALAVETTTIINH